jgi:glycosyltransferase involved in cell wall biosynthesis
MEDYSTMNDISISVAFTTWNRTTLLFEAMRNFLNDDRVTEIVVSDDASEVKVFTELEIFANSYKKIKLHRNVANLDCYKNKRQAVELCTNEWVALLDSDNTYGANYMDRIESLMIAGVNAKTVYQPEFARPHFDFTKYSGVNVTKENVRQYLSDPTFSTMLNAMNYFVNRAEYLRIFDGSVDPVTSDSIFHNYNWLKAGNSIYVVPFLQYNHTVHDQSHYKLNNRRTPRGFHDEVMFKLNQLR